MKRVIVESPLSGDFERNQRYARLCCLDCLERGEAPLASHLLYTQMLDDRDFAQRELGMQAGFVWGECADLVAAYEDLGVSAGMARGIVAAERRGIDVVRRVLAPHLLRRLDAQLAGTPGAAGQAAHYEPDPNEPEE